MFAQSVFTKQHRDYLINVSLQDDNVQDFDERWDQALQSASETPTEMVLEGLCKSKLQDSVQLQTVLALCDPETIRNNGPPRYQRLTGSVRQQLDQTMRTRNIRVRSEIVERGAETKSRKGMKA